MKKTAIIFILFLLTACSSNNTKVLGLQTTFYDRFIEACQDNMECMNTARDHFSACFNRDLANNSLKADLEKKRYLNEVHIRKIQQCMRNKTGTDYWSSNDMVSAILDRD